MLSVKEKIGRNIKKLRCDKNLSQEKLAELMGLSTPAISNIENGKTLTSFATLEKMTKILDVNLYELFLFCGECKEEILYKKLFENINKPEIKGNSEKLLILYEISENLLRSDKSH